MVTKHQADLTVYVVAQAYKDGRGEITVLSEADTDRDTAIERFEDNNGGDCVVYAVTLKGCQLPIDGEGDVEVTLQVPQSAGAEVKPEASVK
jgi:hypothetical protein